MADRLRTAIRIGKAALAAAALASAAFAAARLAYPYLLPLLSSSVPGAWIAVQLIVLVVWKLSLNRSHESQRPLDNKPESTSNSGEPPAEQSDSPHLVKEPPPPPKRVKELAEEIEVKKGNNSMEAEWMAVMAGSASPGPLPLRKSEKWELPPPRAMRKSATVREGRGRSDMRMPPPPLPESVNKPVEMEGNQEDDSMEATWRSIMAGSASPGRPPLRKSDTWELPPRAEPEMRESAAFREGGGRPEMRKSATFREGGGRQEMRKSAMFQEGGGAGWRGREALVVGRDELFGRVEAFIQMHYDHLRLQRQESEQRQFTEMVSHAY